LSNITCFFKENLAYRQAMAKALVALMLARSQILCFLTSIIKNECQFMRGTRLLHRNIIRISMTQSGPGAMLCLLAGFRK
jgi:hypothetical protein